MYEELVHEEQREGFGVRLYFCEECDSPRGQFMTEDGEDDEELLAKIDSGFYLWFCAKVAISKAGVELGVNYLGGCCYESTADFMAEGGYYEDMVFEAMSEARKTLEALCED